jgi:hypothetical protein
VGLDEWEVAETMAGLIKRLTGKEDSEKTLLDAVRESIRVLEPPKATVRAGASDVPVTVILNHDVPRPDRQPLDELFAIQNSPKCQTAHLPPRFVHDDIDRSIRDGVDVSSQDDCTTETGAEDRGNTPRVKLGYEPFPK